MAGTCQVRYHATEKSAKYMVKRIVVQYILLSDTRRYLV